MLKERRERHEREGGTEGEKIGKETETWEC